MGVDVGRWKCVIQNCIAFLVLLFYIMWRSSSSFIIIILFPYFCGCYVNILTRILIYDVNAISSHWKFYSGFFNCIIILLSSTHFITWCKSNKCERGASYEICVLVRCWTISVPKGQLITSLDIMYILNKRINYFEYIPLRNKFVAFSHWKYIFLACNMQYVILCAFMYVFRVFLPTKLLSLSSICDFWAKNWTN